MLAHKVQRQRLERLITELAIRPLVIEDEAGLWASVFRWLEKYADHEPAWADGYIAIVSSLDRTTKLWTYDGEFKTVWRRLDGTKVPLAVR